MVNVGCLLTHLAVDLPVQTGAKTQVLDNRWERLAEREGFETDSENDSLPGDPQKTP
jgi:hypothetical protein